MSGHEEVLAASVFAKEPESESQSAIAYLKYHILKNWKRIIHPTVHAAGGTTENDVANLITEKTRWVILDFDNHKMDCSMIEQVFGVDDVDGGEKGPLVDLLRHHPQIRGVTLSKAMITPGRVPMAEVHFFQFLGCWSKPYCSNLLVTILDTAYMPAPNPSWTTDREEFDQISLWKMPWPQVHQLDDIAVGELNKRLPLDVVNPIQDWNVSRDFLFRQRYMEYWPYPPGHLKWLNTCLDILPTTDSLFKYLKIHEDDFETDYDEETSLTLHGKLYPRSVVAFCARYVTTFREHLDLPAPPHPLVWND